LVSSSVVPELTVAIAIDTGKFDVLAGFRAEFVRCRCLQKVGNALAAGLGSG
jgi:hypothetical protein